MTDDVDEIVSFIRDAKQHGATDEFILRMLVANGWSAPRCFRAFVAHYAALPNAVPLPEPKMRATL